MTAEHYQIATTDAAEPLSRFSLGVRAGSVLQVSGQGPLDSATGQVLHIGDVGAQTKVAMEAVRAILQGGGASMSDVVMLRVYLTRQADFAEMNIAYERFIAEHVGDHTSPARTTVVVGLPLEGMLVEVDALAVLNHA